MKNVGKKIPGIRIRKEEDLDVESSFVTEERKPLWQEHGTEHY